MGFIREIFEEIIEEVVEEVVADAAISEAVDTMYSMVGNAGQQSILDNGMSGFEEWANQALEGEPTPLDPSQLGISGSAYEGTYEIWGTGEEIIMNYASMIGIEEVY